MTPLSFIRFSVPKQAVRIADQTGAAQASQVQELFDYTIHTDWVKVSEDTSAAAQNTYVYAYGTEAACKALVAEASTPSLFKRKSNHLYQRAGRTGAGGERFGNSSRGLWNPDNGSGHR